MRIAMTSLVVLAIGAGAARSDPPSQPYAVAINAPHMWAQAFSIAVSGYVGLAPHHGLRANVSSYRDGDIFNAVVFIAGEEGSKADSGRTTDLGIGWVYCRRRLWDGLTLELGAMRRAREIETAAALQTRARVTRTYGARALVGWSWLFADHLFVALAAGASVGWEHGHETDSADAMPRALAVRRSVSRSDLAAEGYLRIGVAFGR